MIIIDGSYGEGGGQILRYAASLAAAAGEKVKVINIRANRPNPGLRPQHLGGLKLLHEICGGDVSGLKIGSKEVVLKYDYPKAGRYYYDVGTAGSVTLVMQTLLPVLSCGKGRFEVTLVGGTDVKWSPTIDYFRHVFMWNLSKFGVKGRIELIKRGYYPRGGGRVKLVVDGAEGKFKKVDFTRASIIATKVISVCSNLPSHIASRQIEAVKFKLEQLSIGSTEYLVEVNGPDKAFGKGTSIVIYSEMENSIRCGGDSIGEKGKPAESVGWDAYQRYLEWYNSTAALDRFMGDMVIPYIFLAGGGNFSAPILTKHMESALYVAKTILGINFQVIQGESRVDVMIG